MGDQLLLAKTSKAGQFRLSYLVVGELNLLTYIILTGWTSHKLDGISLRHTKYAILESMAHTNNS